MAFKTFHWTFGAPWRLRVHLIHNTVTRPLAFSIRFIRRYDSRWFHFLVDGIFLRGTINDDEGKELVALLFAYYAWIAHCS